MSAKFSIGYSFGEDLDYNKYLNYTMGIKRVFFADEEIGWQPAYTFSEIHAGFLRKEVKGFLGASLGSIRSSSNTSVQGKRWSVYYGGFGFASFEVEKFQASDRRYDFGLTGVLPIPLSLLLMQG